MFLNSLTFLRVLFGLFAFWWKQPWILLFQPYLVIRTWIKCLNSWTTIISSKNKTNSLSSYPVWLIVSLRNNMSFVKTHFVINTRYYGIVLKFCPFQEKTWQNSILRWLELFRDGRFHWRGGNHNLKKISPNFWVFILWFSGRDHYCECSEPTVVSLNCLSLFDLTILFD